MNQQFRNPPKLRAGYWTWSFDGADSRIVFVGKGPDGVRQNAFADMVGESRIRLSWPHQMHSATVIEASQEGLCGRADALTTGDRGIALSVGTADCVPIALEGAARLATVHAGWRGLAARIIPRAVAELAPDPGPIRAWIGPAIGPCCYEVGAEVAHRVVAASDASVLRERRPRPHLDLQRAAEIQLRRLGVHQAMTVQVCTRCSPKWLWSYRRSGTGADRNWTFMWREPQPNDADAPDGSDRSRRI